jgi:hypothetical protein
MRTARLICRIDDPALRARDARIGGSSIRQGTRAVRL